MGDTDAALKRRVAAVEAALDSLRADLGARAAAGRVDIPIVGKRNRERSPAR